MLSLCQHGYEDLLERELAGAGLAVTEKGPGWARCGSDLGRDESWAGTLPQPELAFPQLTLPSPREFKGESVNALAQQLADYFFESLRGERIEAAWPCVFQTVPEVAGLGRRANAVEKAFGESLKKKLSRIAKLATPDLPRGPGRARGLFVFFADFGRVFAAREAWLGGQRRMADDEAAPSRSYLKVEEAYIVLGREPQPGETVVDLGAAPGGWSYSAAKRGARVIAVDNGPLKGAAVGHPSIKHLRQDGFRFRPQRPVDWLVCDMVEQPQRVTELMIEWFAGGLAQHAIFNLKLPMKKRVAALQTALDTMRGVFNTKGLRYRLEAKQLYHDREEVTVFLTRAKRYT